MKAPNAEEMTHTYENAAETRTLLTSCKDENRLLGNHDRPCEVTYLRREGTNCVYAPVACTLIFFTLKTKFYCHKNFVEAANSGVV